jgi:hypothetical protein
MNMQVQREKNDMQRETNKVKSENANNKATSK